MKVEKIIVLENDVSSDLRGMYERELKENCTKDSNKYRNCMGSFDKMMNEVASAAFKLGMENPK